ncbi:MAG TPA: NAD/NADP octopine/nopaline dehydrogenase family protein [Thermoanaerobaculia bacterium]|nr:NAD/NADP octopine/nopaline dehydrogenase family protein [Thermoanaerobaculia bacterium]
MSHRIRVVICGTGSSTHVLAAVLSQSDNVDVRVVTLSAGKAKQWNEIMAGHRLTVTVRTDAEEPAVITARAFTVTSDPEWAARGCDVLIVSVPAFLHLTYLTALEPYIEDGCMIVGLPGQNGFEFDVREALGPRLKSCVAVNFESLPWICRVTRFARSASILGTKASLAGAVQGDLAAARIGDPLATLQCLLGQPPTLAISGHPLGITLRSPNGYSHPPMMFGRWKNWDGEGLAEPPLLYEGIDEETAELLADVSDEVVATSRRIMDEYPEVDLSQVIPMYDWDIGCYGNDIRDKTNLMTALRTNAGYAGITHPMIRLADDRYAPDFNHRFLAEDVPFGLVVVRGVAELAGVRTRRLDSVLCWCQDKMGKEYLVGSSLTGRDIATTRSPQRYGFTRLSEIL